MCGICGIYSFNSTDIEKNKNQVSFMCDLMRDRGPDHKGILENESVVLGHTRLAIMDPLNNLADQPIESNNWIMVFNGEIYNFRKIKAELLVKGRVFKTESDTEVLLLCLEEYGFETTLEKINGIYAIAAINKQDGKLYLVRDRLGIKPLYYYFDKEHKKFIFSSTPASIAKTARKSWDLDYKSVFSFFHLGAPSTKGTFFKGINRLRPAQYMIINQNQEIDKTGIYWTPEVREGEIDEKVKEIIQLEKEAHVSSAVFLSGGIDSSVMAAILKDVEGFHLSSPEQKYAEYVAEKLGFKLKIREFADNLDFDEILKRYAISSGEASASSPIPLLVSELIAQEGYKVAFSANGADELFFGYPRTPAKDLKDFNNTALDYEQTSYLTDEEQYYHIFRVPRRGSVNPSPLGDG